jgi:hypothetical protein
VVEAMNYQTRRKWLFRIADALDAIPFAVQIWIAVAAVVSLVASLWLW